MQSCKKNSESSIGDADSTAIAVGSTVASETPAAAVAPGGTDIKGIVGIELEKLDDEFISKFYDEIEREKEDRFVKLMIDIMVSLTLKELYGEDDNLPS